MLASSRASSNEPGGSCAGLAPARLRRAALVRRETASTTDFAGGVQVHDAVGPPDEGHGREAMLDRFNQASATARLLTTVS